MQSLQITAKTTFTTAGPRVQIKSEIKGQILRGIRWGGRGAQKGEGGEDMSRTKKEHSRYNWMNTH